MTPERTFISGLSPENIVVLVSGGVDSLLCVAKFPDAVRLHVRFGQPEADQEQRACHRLFDDDFETVGMTLTPRSPDGVFVPARNLMLCTLALQYAVGPNVAIILGAMKDDMVIDKNAEALDRMSDILSRQSGGKVVVYSPFINRCKHDAIGDWLGEAGLPGAPQWETRAALLRATWSCYSGGAFPCGGCKACFRWFCAMKANGVETPFVPNEQLCETYLDKLHTYDPARQASIVSALDGANGKRVLVVDIDGTLTVEREGFDYLSRTPNLDAVNHLRELGRSHWIVLYSSRRERDRAATFYWLTKRDVAFDALLLDKPRASRYVDDLSVRSVLDV